MMVTSEANILRPRMLAIAELNALQSAQQQHDLKNHFDILSLHRVDRLKHYALHYAKYVGRLARGAKEKKTISETLVDAFLVALSTANALNQRLAEIPSPFRDADYSILPLADATGRFADACEKIDHLENFRDMALQANREIVTWIIGRSALEDIDLSERVAKRRQELAGRQVYNMG